MRQKTIRRFPFGMTAYDCENLEIVRALNPRITDETALLRIALENMANNSGTPKEVNALRKTYKKNMAKAREMTQ